MTLLNKLATYKKLGVINLLSVAVYRFAIKIGYFHNKQPIQNRNTSEHFFSPVATTSFKRHENKIKTAQLKAFGWLKISTNKIPNWLKAVDSEVVVDDNQQHWSKLNDFSLNVGDVKTVWELSRFDWLLVFSLKYLNTGNRQYLLKLNAWLKDWCENNPINEGVNWKCGQEASIRVLHLTASAFLLEQDKALTTSLAQLIYDHLLRIEPTIYYAMAQDNNHGTSEASALYIGCLFLELQAEFKDNAKIKKWKNKGKYWLENRVEKLIAEDGCFSQNSVNYHRLMLDTLSLTEFFRRHFNQKEFGLKFYQKTTKASKWLYLMTDTSSGKTPILGANDGAKLLPVSPCDYSDYRASVQWAFSLFCGYCPFTENGDHHQLSTLFPASNKNERIEGEVHPSMLKTGFQLLANKTARCYLRTPNINFRPSACDALHLDLWLGKQNVFISSGSYSYNCEAKLQQYFPSVEAHNTVQFDQSQQMPKLSRFLYSNWINAVVDKRTSKTLSARYHNVYQHNHNRLINLSDDSLTVIDTLSGFKKQAVLRWHLLAEHWQLEENKLIAENISIVITADVKIEKIALVEGYQSRYYLLKDVTQVLEITLACPGQITTSVNWLL